MKVVIDHDRCTGHGRCYMLAEALFVDDDEGYGQLRGDGTVGEEQMTAARHAVGSCPEQAIALEE